MMISILYPDWHNVPQIEKDLLWLTIKEDWQIEDTRKAVVLKICNSTWKGFKKRLINKFLKTGDDPPTKYPYLDKSTWEQFKPLKSTSEFQEKSERGRQNAKLNKNPARIGPRGYAGMRPEWQKKIESGAVSSEIAQIQNDRIEKDRQLSQGEWVPGPGEDPLIAVLGPEHSGRTRAVGHMVGLRKTILGIDEKKRKSHKKLDLKEIVERKVNESMRALEERVIQRLMSKYGGMATRSLGLRKSSCSSAPTFDGLDEIEEPTPCNLMTCGISSKFQCAKGLVYPHGNELVNSVPLLTDHKKVRIDQIVPHFESMELPVKTELMTTLLEARNSFVQWPRNAIVLTLASKREFVPHEQSSSIVARDEQPSSQPPASTKSAPILDPVQVSEGTSLYAQCRSWLKNGFTFENQPQYVDCVKSLPKPLPASTIEARKEDDMVEIEEETEDVEQLSVKELLQQHIKHAKKVRVRLRNQRLQRIARYKDRLALLLPPVVDQQPKTDPASRTIHTF